MRYGIQRLGDEGWFTTSLLFDTAKDRDEELRYLRNRRESEAKALRPIRLLSHEEAKRKAVAKELRARADLLKKRRQDFDSDSYSGWAGGACAAIEEEIHSLTVRAAELWSEGE